jgi:GH15 family glucan-1,4-alpha-glucosidase
MAHNDITGIMKSTKSEPHRKSYGNGHPRGYLPIESYGIIGNMRTAALCGIDGSIDFMCYPEFDSPSIFCRILDDKKGGHFSITPCISTTKKQQAS